MTHRFVLALLTLTPIVAAAQSDQQPKRHHSQKEVRAQMREDERKTATEVQKKLDDYLKIATNPKEHPEHRRSMLELIGHSQDIRAAKVLRDYADDASPEVSDGALSGLRTMTMTLDDNPTMLGEVKNLIDEKIKKIAKEGPRDEDRGGWALVDLLNNVGDDHEAVELGRKLLAKGHDKVVYQFGYRDESVEPPVFRIRPAAKQFIIDATAKDQSETARVSAATILRYAGDYDNAFGPLVDVMLHGKNIDSRMGAMKQLREIGDERSKDAVREAMKDPALARSAKYVLMSWDQRPKK
jgi:hypothetical protein